jgi:hypothetical protein
VLVSGREATRMLRPVARGDAQSRVLLRAGLAGDGVDSSAGTLYDEEAVRSVVDRPVVRDSDLLSWDLPGVYVARLSRTTPLRVSEPWRGRARAVSAVPPMSAWSLSLIGVQVSVWGRLPWVATLGGFVVVCADLVGLTPDEECGNRFQLEPPGPWHAAVEGRRWPTGRGGRPWYVWSPVRVGECDRVGDPWR